ncbi:MAG TPA: DUF4912 domain-containing protein [Pyrinomonadaceae bacterium]|nr:DUF4912 domain-containing protein [Pyrinomonadaceae bacterium]
MLQPDDTLEATPATDAEPASAARARASALEDALPLALKRDSIQLLLQSPNKLFLYWSFASDPRAALRAAFGELAAHYRLAVRLVLVESGEEFVLDAPPERMRWFEVYPRHVYRADVGFHAPGRPFVRLLSSNEVQTPPDSASHLSADEQEFHIKSEEFARLLGGAGYESYARGLTNAPAGDTNAQGGLNSIEATSEGTHHANSDAANEYPHR